MKKLMRKITKFGALIITMALVMSMFVSCGMSKDDLIDSLKLQILMTQLPFQWI